MDNALSKSGHRHCRRLNQSPPLRDQPDSGRLRGTAVQPWNWSIVVEIIRGAICVMRTQRDEVALLSRAEDFLKVAEQCRLKAAQETDPLDGQLWLVMAEQWSQLAQYVADRPDDC